MQPVNRSIGTPNIGTEGKVQLHPDDDGSPRRRINASVVSIANPKRVAAVCRTRTASVTISGPIPSPFATAIFMYVVFD